MRKKYKKLMLLSIITLVSCNIGQTGEREIVDLAGDTVNIPIKPKRVVARTANSTSFLVGMELQDRIVGTMDSIAINSWSKKFMPDIDAITAFPWSPSIESLYEVESDLVLLADPVICRELRTKGINAITYKQYNNKEMIDSVKLLGEIFNNETYSNKWLNYYEETLADINSFIKNIPINERPTVYYIYGQSNKGLYRSSGYNSINSEMIELAGGTYALKEFDSSMTKFTAEEVLATNPDIVVVGGVYQHLLINELKASPVWQNIPAITNDRVYNIPMSFLPWDLYGVEFPLLLKYLCSVFYPAYEFDAQKETQSFIKEFYNMEFSNEEVSFMLGGLNPNGEVFFS